MKLRRLLLPVVLALAAVPCEDAIVYDVPGGLTACDVAHAVSSARWRVVDSRLVAMAEAVARLEHLRAIGRADRLTAPDGAVTYTRADESAPRERLAPSA